MSEQDNDNTMTTPDETTSPELIVASPEPEFSIRKSAPNPDIGPESQVYSVWCGDKVICALAFQHGASGEHGVNGVSTEAVLAIVLDRLMTLQEGRFPALDNVIAIRAVKEALYALQKRKRERAERGVLGVSLP